MEETKGKNKSSGLKMFFAGTFIGLIIVGIFGIFAVKNMPNNKYYFDESEKKVAKEKVDLSSDKDDPKTNTSGKNKSKTTNKKKTEVEAENVYEFQLDGEPLTEEDAKELIIQDSEDQKKKNTKEISKIEDKFIKDYNITAANLLEMDPTLAESMTAVFKEIYEEYPDVNGYLTNITLWNTDYSLAETIAAFRPFFMFAANTDSLDGYPIITKMQLLLSARYFLNESKLEKTIKSSEKKGWFPENCTKYSPAAHELGHYISFIAMMKKYGVDSTLIIDSTNEDICLDLLDDFDKGTYSLEMLQEAYRNYTKDYGTSLDFDEWRGEISGYALAKDNEGDYIYDETIAEAFHDVYLNGKKAAIPSQYIVEVLKERVKR